jgi:hypothetical protein
MNNCVDLSQGLPRALRNDIHLQSHAPWEGKVSLTQALINLSEYICISMGIQALLLFYSVNAE